MERKKQEAIRRYEAAQEELSSKPEVAEAEAMLFEERSPEDRQAAKELLDEVESKFSGLRDARDAAEARLTAVLEAEGSIDLHEYDELQREADAQLRVAQEAADRAVLLRELAEEALDFAVKEAEGKTKEDLAQEAQDLVDGIRESVPKLDPKTLEMLAARARRLLDEGSDYEAIHERLRGFAEEVASGKYTAGRYYSSPASRLVHGK